MAVPLKSFEVVLDVDVPVEDKRTVADVRQLIWDLVTTNPYVKLDGAIVSVPSVRELASFER